jgi:hypothetical protein
MARGRTNLPRRAKNRQTVAFRGVPCLGMTQPLTVIAAHLRPDRLIVMTNRGVDWEGFCGPTVRPCSRPRWVCPPVWGSGARRDYCTRIERGTETRPNASICASLPRRARDP